MVAETRVRDFAGRLRQVRALGPPPRRGACAAPGADPGATALPSAGVLRPTSLAHLADLWLPDLDLRDLAGNTEENYRTCLRTSLVCASQRVVRREPAVLDDDARVTRWFDVRRNVGLRQFREPGKGRESHLAREGCSSRHLPRRAGRRAVPARVHLLVAADRMHLIPRETSAGFTRERRRALRPGTMRRSKDRAPRRDFHG